MLKIVVVDVLKPHKPDILEFGELLRKEKSIKCVNLSVYAIDEKTESVKIVLEGNNINFKKVRKIVEDNGAVVHSIDKAVLGEKKIICVPEPK